MRDNRQVCSLGRVMLLIGFLLEELVLRSWFPKVYTLYFKSKLGLGGKRNLSLVPLHRLVFLVVIPSTPQRPGYVLVSLLFLAKSVHRYGKEHSRHGLPRIYGSTGRAAIQSVRLPQSRGRGHTVHLCHLATASSHRESTRRDAERDVERIRWEEPIQHHLSPGTSRFFGPSKRSLTYLGFNVCVWVMELYRYHE